MKKLFDLFKKFNKPTVKIKLGEKALLPVYSSEVAAGADLFAVEDCIINPGEIKRIRSDLFMEIPKGYHGIIWSRSGLVIKHNIITLAGLIDNDYRGEVGPVLCNLGSQPFKVEKGMRVAQIFFVKIPQMNFIEVENLKNTKRNKGGFGSTGI